MKDVIGIIGAMEEEVTLLRSGLEQAKTETAGGMEFYSGLLEKRPVTLLRCGVGKVNAAAGCALLIDRFRPAAVINTGSAGGIDPSLRFGDAVISDSLLYYDVDVTAFNYAPGQLPGMPPVFTVPEDLILRAEQAADELKREKILPEDFNHVRGLIGSGDRFMHEPERIAAVKKLFPRLGAVEMEGAAIAHTCFLFGVPALIIRALSDIAGAESPLTFDQFLPAAARHSGDIVRRIVRNWT
ncbi:MAG: 5'-methylthioadenosine/S-adenosylhomocysteine nucleosidase [Treponema sp.]|jgi:adenosylhomocysteine nucleosidase|nr:5'-methylthioadenosine/S-adenosylhomocysteine nucleosidase [Treponema sp.]